MAKYIIGGALGLVAVIVALMWFGVIPGLRDSGGPVIQRANLTMWGVQGEKSVYDPLIKAFQGANPGVKITYVEKSPDRYEEELLRAFAAGTGPDIFNIYHTWLAKYKDILVPVPQDVISLTGFQASFVEAVQQDFISEGNIYGITQYLDTLALYYNLDLFNSAGIVFPPKDWDEFADYARRLTTKRQAGDISVSGAALGGGKNVVAAGDILAVLMAQYGAPIADATGKIRFRPSGGGAALENAAEQALQFYTSFAKQANLNYAWSPLLAQDSETAFAQQRAAMMIGYADARGRLYQKSPRLKYSVAPLPQVKGAAIKKNYADYWGWGVYKQSASARTAWQFLKYLTSPEISAYYLATTSRPAAQRELIAQQQKSAPMSVFADQALSAVTWVRPNEQAVRDVFVEMIEAQVSSDQPLKQTLENGETKINSLLRR